MAKTIRVRIAVAVTNDGQWYASGRRGDGDDYMRRCARWGVDEDPHRITWIEADVLMPDSSEAVVEGEVSQ